MFEVYIEENSRFADESGRLKIGEFNDFDEALRRAKKIVDDFLAGNYEEKMTAEELCRLYKTFGEDVFIVSDAGGAYFSAWEYAEERAREITRE